MLYYLSKHDFFTNLDLLIRTRQEFSKKLKSYIKSEEFRNILKSCAIAFVLVILFSATILAYGSNLSFITQSSTFASGSKGEVIDNAYTTDTFFFLHDFPNFLFADNVSFDEGCMVEPSAVSLHAVNLADVKVGKPIRAYIVDNYNESGTGFSAFAFSDLFISYDSTYPDRIDLLITGGVGYHWTASGVAYFD